jgi:hypothetical protein
MYKLSKLKAFEASQSITTQSGIEIANLLRSAITVQTVILVGHDGKWHEISIVDLRIDEKIFLENSNLETVAEYLDTHNITLADMKIVNNTPRIAHVLTHDDFQELSDKFPQHSYIAISQLNDYNVSVGGKASVDELTDWLKVCVRDSLTIAELIANRSAALPKPRIIKEDIAELVIDSKTGQASIECDTVPVPSGSVSIGIFETLSPSKITEIQVIRKEQEEIVSKNPVVTITDKTTYAQAKKTLAILLSASTRINGKTGVFTLAKQFVNKFKSDFDKEGTDIEQLSRVPYNSQKKIIEDWDNRLLLQVQNRVKELISVPFTYDTSDDTYSIGFINVTQKDIEDFNDETFQAIVEQGKKASEVQKAAEQLQSAEIEVLKKSNEELKAQLLAFMKLHSPVTEKEPEVSGTFELNTDNTPTIQPELPATEALDTCRVFTELLTPVAAYQLPNPENKLLNALDLAHYYEIEEEQYQERRELYVQALSDCASELQSVFDNPDKTVVKSEEIKKLIEIWK